MKTTCNLFLAIVFTTGLYFTASAQQIVWSANDETPESIAKDKGVYRDSFPAAFKLFNLNVQPLKQQLFSVTDSKTSRSAIISLPNADGEMEWFEVWEASNFDPKLQAQFPEIRAYSGRGITDKYAMLKLSFSPQGIQSTVFRVEKENEFMEPFSADHKTYAVYRSSDENPSRPWSCRTDDKDFLSDLTGQGPESPDSSAGQIKTLRLAQIGRASCRERG